MSTTPGKCGKIQSYCISKNDGTVVTLQFMSYLDDPSNIMIVNKHDINLAFGNNNKLDSVYDVVSMLIRLLQSSRENLIVHMQLLFALASDYNIKHPGIGSLTQQVHKYYQEFKESDRYKDQFTPLIKSCWDRAFEHAYHQLSSLKSPLARTKSSLHARDNGFKNINKIELPDGFRKTPPRSSKPIQQVPSRKTQMEPPKSIQQVPSRKTQMEPPKPSQQVPSRKTQMEPPKSIQQVPSRKTQMEPKQQASVSINRIPPSNTSRPKQQESSTSSNARPRPSKLAKRPYATVVCYSAKGYTNVSPAKDNIIARIDTTIESKIPKSMTNHIVKMHLDDNHKAYMTNFCKHNSNRTSKRCVYTGWTLQDTHPIVCLVAASGSVSDYCYYKTPDASRKSDRVSFISICNDIKKNKRTVFPVCKRN